MLHAAVDRADACSGDGFLADQYVRRLDLLRGGARGGLEAMRAAGTLVMAAAAVGSFVRAADWPHAMQLAARGPAESRLWQSPHRDALR